MSFNNMLQIRFGLTEAGAVQETKRCFKETVTSHTAIFNRALPTASSPGDLLLGERPVLSWGYMDHWSRRSFHGQLETFTLFRRVSFVKEHHTALDLNPLKGILHQRNICMCISRWCKNSQNYLRTKESQRSLQGKQATEIILPEGSRWAKGKPCSSDLRRVLSIRSLWECEQFSSLRIHMLPQENTLITYLHINTRRHCPGTVI